jgi:hypothetical protein
LALYGNLSDNQYGGYFALIGNIDLTGETIGMNITANFGVTQSETGVENAIVVGRGFTGVFDGRGFALIGGTYNNGGILGIVNNNGIVRNLAVVGATLSGANASGIISAAFRGTADNLLVDVVTSTAHLGGVFGGKIWNTARINNTIVYWFERTRTTERWSSIFTPLGDRPNETAITTGTYIFANDFRSAYPDSGDMGAGGFGSGYIDLGIAATFEWNAGGATPWSWKNNLPVGINIRPVNATLTQAGGVNTTTFDDSIWDFSGDKATFKSLA